LVFDVYLYYDRWRFSRLSIDDVMCSMMTWLLGDLFYYGWQLRCFI